MILETGGLLHGLLFSQIFKDSPLLHIDLIVSILYTLQKKYLKMMGDEGLPYTVAAPQRDVDDVSLHRARHWHVQDMRHMVKRPRFKVSTNITNEETRATANTESDECLNIVIAYIYTHSPRCCYCIAPANKNKRGDISETWPKKFIYVRLLRKIPVRARVNCRDTLLQFVRLVYERVSILSPIFPAHNILQC